MVFLRSAALTAVMLAACSTTNAEIGMGYDEAGCDAARRYALSKNGVSMLVLEDGVEVCASSDASLGRENELWSGTKSFVGIMAAAAVQDGLLTLDELAADTLVEWKTDPRKSAVTLRQILSMTSGQPSEIGRPPTYAKAVDGRLNADPGVRFQYGPAPSQTFGEIMRRKLEAAGQPADPGDYLARRVLAPIGLGKVFWRTGNDGYRLMPQGMSLTARQWAAFGEFVRAGGVYNGKALVDPAAFAELFKGSEANAAYGLTWWLPRATDSNDVVTATTDITKNSEKLPADLVVAAGAGDQRLYVIPSAGLTIVRQAELDLKALATGQRSTWSDTHFLELLLGAGSNEAEAQ